MTMTTDGNSTESVSRLRAHSYVACLVLGYIGIYLCRKNFSVAIPLLQEDLGVSKAQLGMVTSVSTIAYMVGKVFWGPIVDTLGGRNGFLGSMILVAVFGAFGAFVPSILLLTIVYSANRLAGAAGWMSMVKLVPEWYGRTAMATAMAFLSLSFVFGGVCATLLAGQIFEWFGSWHAVMGVPSIVLLAIAAVCWIYIPNYGSKSMTSKTSRASFLSQIDLSKWTGLFANRRFLVVCGICFTLTLMREAFNVWTVDFLHEVASSHDAAGEASLRDAAFRSTLFDLLGAAGIVSMGWVYDRVGHDLRRWVLFSIMASLAILLCFLNWFAGVSANAVALAVGVIGFLVYGPYSLLAGVMSVEVSGKERAATVSGLVDAAGYLGGILSGVAFGKLVDEKGYSTGFVALALLAVVTAFLCLLLGRSQSHGQDDSDVSSSS